MNEFVNWSGENPSYRTTVSVAAFLFWINGEISPNRFPRAFH